LIDAACGEILIDYICREGERERKRKESENERERKKKSERAYGEFGLGRFGGN